MTRIHHDHSHAWTRRLLALAAAAALVLGAAGGAMAQDDFDFTDEGDSGGGDTGGGGGDTGGGGGDFDFTDAGGGETGGDTGSKVVNIPMPSGDKPIIVAFFDKVDNTPDRVLDRLTEAMVGHLQEFEDYDTVPGLAVKMELDKMNADARSGCIYDPVCIAGIAKPMGVTKVVIGRITTEGLERPNVALDVIDVNSEAAENFMEFTASKNVKGQEKELRPAVYKLFNRQMPTDPNAVKKGPVQKETPGLPTGQLIASIGCGVGGLALIGVGVKFGLDASDMADQIAKGRDNRTMTQVTAQKNQDEAEKNATLANVMYGLGAVAIAAAVVLVIIRPGDELADDQRPRADLDLFVSPAIGPDGAGVVGGFRF